MRLDPLRCNSSRHYYPTACRILGIRRKFHGANPSLGRDAAGSTHFYLVRYQNLLLYRNYTISSTRFATWISCRLGHIRRQSVAEDLGGFRITARNELQKMREGHVLIGSYTPVPRQPD